MSLLCWSQLSLSSSSTASATTSPRCYSRLLVGRTFAVRPHQGPALSSFQPVTIEEVRKLLSAMPSKSSPLDALLCSLLESCSEVFAPAIARLANLSMQTGKFPARYKRAHVLPLLKKSGLDSSSPANYRPISNLATVSKVIERLVLTIVCDHICKQVTLCDPIWQVTLRSSVMDFSIKSYTYLYLFTFTSARIYQLQRVPVCLPEGTFYGERTVGGPGLCIHSCRQP